MTEEKAAVVLPPAHRYEGRPYGWVPTSLIGHTTEHAIEIRQVMTTACGAPDALGEPRESVVEDDVRWWHHLAAATCEPAAERDRDAAH